MYLICSKVDFVLLTQTAVGLPSGLVSDGSYDGVDILYILRLKAIQ